MRRFSSTNNFFLVAFDSLQLRFLFVLIACFFSVSNSPSHLSTDDEEEKKRNMISLATPKTRWVIVDKKHRRTEGEAARAVFFFRLYKFYIGCCWAEKFSSQILWRTLINPRQKPPQPPHPQHQCTNNKRIKPSTCSHVEFWGFSRAS